MTGDAAYPSSAFSELRRIDSGRWGVAVSGGADSVALLRWCHGQGDLALHVIHLDHETRGGQSGEDAAFVEAMAASLGLPSTVVKRSAVERDTATPHGNPSARFRAARLKLYADVVARHGLSGVLLAHHADDQAETVLLRLLRGGGYSAWRGMAEETVVGGVRLLRPLLGVRRESLRAYLRQLDQPWREDDSNESDTYARNRVRRVLAERPALAAALVALAHHARRLHAWVATHRPALPNPFSTAQLAALPDLVARATAADWLRRQGVSADDVSPAHVTAILRMAADAASPPRHTAPDGVRVWRRRKMIGATRTLST